MLLSSSRLASPKSLGDCWATLLAASRTNASQLAAVRCLRAGPAWLRLTFLATVELELSIILAFLGRGDVFFTIRATERSRAGLGQGRCNPNPLIRTPRSAGRLSYTGKAAAG